jgi:hypothetical protein
MSFTLIGAQANSRPYATSVDVESAQAALIMASEMRGPGSYVPQFVIDSTTGECMRAVRPFGWEMEGYDGPEWEPSDTAYVVVGSETPDEWFKNPDLEQPQIETAI